MTDPDHDYWRKNLRLVAFLLVIWAVISFGAGLWLAPALNQVTFLGVKLGFWFAQQGAILGFIGLIFIYVWQMNKLDDEFDADKEEQMGTESSSSKDGAVG